MVKTRVYRNTGTIIKRGDGYIGYIRKMIKGKRYCSPKFAARKRTDVQLKINEWNTLKEGKDGFDRLLAHLAPLAPKATYTVGNFLDAWWKEASPNWAATTLALHTSTYQKYLKDDVLRSLPFSELTKVQVKDFFASLPENITPATRHRIYKLLRTAFQTAVLDDRLPSNPIKTSSSPKRGVTPAGAGHPISEKLARKVTRAETKELGVR